jgi:hypothetical protein
VQAGRSAAAFRGRSGAGSSMDRASVSGAEGCRFDPCPARQAPPVVLRDEGCGPSGLFFEFCLVRWEI